MAVVTLRSPLRELAGGSREVSLEGDTVGEVLGSLEERYPRLTGWVRDEHGRIREHVNVFVNEERAGLETPVTTKDRMHVLPAISGGAVETMPQVQQKDAMKEDETEILAGTRKGLFVLRGPRGGPLRVVARRFD